MPVSIAICGLSCTMFDGLTVVVQPTAVMFSLNAAVCTKLKLSNPAVDKVVPLQLKPAGSVHASDMNVPGYNTPSSTRAPSASITIRINQAYVITY